MATTTTVTSNYAGKEAGTIIGQAFKEADTIAKGFVTVYPNVNYNLNLRKIQLTGGKREYTCGFLPAGAITLSEKILAPKKFKDDFSVCKETFRAQWSEDTMGASAHNDNAPRDIMDAILVEKLGQTAEELDSNIWNGNGANADEFDGFLKLFLADADVIDVDLPAATTEANVEANIKLALAAVPIALRRNTLKVGVSPDIYQAYTFLLISKGISNGLGGDANTAIRMGKYILEEVNGLPTNTIVIADQKNLIFGTGLLADHNEVLMSDEDEIGLLTGLVRGTMVYNAGVNYYNGAEIVWAREI
tara:strand:+ start:929 stop:1840 length:912 start_codon:yes stop_codon:yes gene_type:complete